MDVELQARHLDLTDTVRDYVDKKVGRLDRYLPDIATTRVDLDRRVTHSQGEVYTTQITLWVNGTVLRAEETNSDLLAAVDLAAEKIHRQIERYRGKRLDRWRGRPGAESALAEEDLAEPEEEDGPMISRRKRFAVFAMSEAEALEQFALLGHDFFLFRNADSGEMNVLYKRRDGKLGLIEPELA